ncbi:MAG: hypothetical protein JSW55_13180 [Chloroflexota bacterium]|nr:MAG: hypothetical protein JSW55_13180 [Chloroflexota bacterium]
MSKRIKVTLLIVLLVGLSIWAAAVAAQQETQETSYQPPVGWPNQNARNELGFSGQADDAIDITDRPLDYRTDLAFTASYTAYLPLVTRPTPIINGDFELGPVAWEQYSSNGWQLIFDSSELLVPPHSGSWAVWMGGDFNEESVLWQTVKVPSSNPTLRYWHWIASEDVCGYDIAGVAINLDEVVDAFWLCDLNNTGWWVERWVDLSPYAGQTVELDFVAFTDDSWNSNLFIDDISLGNVATDSGDAGLFEIETAGSATSTKQPRTTRLLPYQPDNTFGQGLQEIRREFNARLSEG